MSKRDNKKQKKLTKACSDSSVKNMQKNESDSTTDCGSSRKCK